MLTIALFSARSPSLEWTPRSAREILYLVSPDGAVQVGAVLRLLRTEKVCPSFPPAAHLWEL